MVETQDIETKYLITFLIFVNLFCLSVFLVSGNQSLSLVSKKFFSFFFEKILSGLFMDIMSN